MNWLNFLEILRKLRGKNEKINITETEKATESNRSKQILRKIILRSHNKIVWSRVPPPPSGPLDDNLFVPKLWSADVPVCRSWLYNYL